MAVTVNKAIGYNFLFAYLFTGAPLLKVFTLPRIIYLIFL